MAAIIAVLNSKHQSLCFGEVLDGHVAVDGASDRGPVEWRTLPPDAKEYRTVALEICVVDIICFLPRLVVPIIEMVLARGEEARRRAGVCRRRAQFGGTEV